MCVLAAIFFLPFRLIGHNRTYSPFQDRSGDEYPGLCGWAQCNPNGSCKWEARDRIGDMMKETEVGLM